MSCVKFRLIVSVAAATALATALVAPAQAAEFTKSTKKTPAQGSLSLDMGPSVFAELKRQGLSFYSLGGPSVGLGDNGGLGMDFNVRAVDGTGRTFTDNEGSSVAWWNGPGNRFLYVGSPTLIRDGRSGTITARVFANNPGDGTGDWGRITLFDVEGLRSTKIDGKPNGYQGRLTLHDGVDVLLNRALFNRDFDAGPFTPGMRLGSFFMELAPQG